MTNIYRYMTVSSRGITIYIKDKSEFINIQDWEKEVNQYQTLKKI